MQSDNLNREQPEPAEGEYDEAEWDAWFDSVGLSRPESFQGESLAPPVRDDLLRRLLRCELPQAECRAVLLLVHSYRSWYDAYTKLMLDEYRLGRQRERER